MRSTVFGREKLFKRGGFEAEAINGYLTQHLEEYLENEFEQRQKGYEERQNSGGINEFLRSSSF